MDNGIHVIVRYVSKLNRSNPMTGEVSGDELDKVCSDWYAKGYRVASSNFIEVNPEGFGVLIIMQKL